MTTYSKANANRDAPLPARGVRGTNVLKLLGPFTDALGTDLVTFVGLLDA